MRWSVTRLREVIRADTFTAVARTDLAAPFFRQFGIGLLLSLVEEAGFQDAQGLGTVFQLGPFILTFDDHPRRDMGHADGRTRLIDVLAAGTGGAEIVDADVVHVEVDFDVFRFRQTATVAVDVWIRPPASVTGTRWTRWTPDSYFNLP